jgi:hypothetical protein
MVISLRVADGKRNNDHSNLNIQDVRSVLWIWASLGVED